jgi:hypothetical protein
MSSNTMKSITLKTSVNSEHVKDRASIKLDEYMTWSNQFICNRLRQPVKGLENMKKIHIKIFCLCDGFIFFIQVLYLLLPALFLNYHIRSFFHEFLIDIPHLIDVVILIFHHQ